MTARDKLVVATSRSELLERIAALRDPKVSDEEIRRRFFGRSRGQKYLRGDTRSWKLAVARDLLAGDDNWQNHVRTCSYRPLDDRAIYWHRKMIDWRRDVVSQLMVEGNNPAIVARRQLPEGTNDGFFWITRWPTIDGIVRSDNRGNEFIFPMFADAAGKRTNFSERFLDQVSSALGFDAINFNLEKAAFGHGPGVTVFGYVAGLLFSPAYRQEHRAQMQSAFIPVCLPRDEEKFRSIAQHGLEIIRELTTPLDSQHDLQVASSALSMRIRIPEFDGRCIRMGEAILMDNVAASDWEFRVGQHQVCRKWLADRRGGELTRDLFAKYTQVVRMVQRFRIRSSAD